MAGCAPVVRQQAHKTGARRVTTTLAPVASLTPFNPQPGRRSRVAGSDEGDLDGESRADAWFRVDVERSIDRGDPLPDSDKPELAIASRY